MNYVFELLLRHWNTIATRLDGQYPHEPYLDEFDERGAVDWGAGFLLAVDGARPSWRKLFRDEDAYEAANGMMSLCYCMAEEDVLTEDQREELIETIPERLAAIRAARMRRAPVRTSKVGRNEPCPCGSGRKFKQCCLRKEGEAVN
jgi:yecA family protein